MIQMRRTGRPARHAARTQPVHDQRVFILFDGHAIGLKPARHGVNAVRFLNAQLLDAAHDGLAGGKGRHDRQDRIFINHRRRPLRRHLNALHIAAEAHAQIGHRLAAFFAGVLEFNLGPHLDQGEVKPVAGQVLTDAGHKNVRPLNDQRGADRESGRGRITRHGHGLRAQLGLAGEGDDIALFRGLNRQCRAKAQKHPLGMVARWLLFNHHGLAGGI